MTCRVFRLKELQETLNSCKYVAYMRMNTYELVYLDNEKTSCPE
jgi:hypothetical protein